MAKPAPNIFQANLPLKPTANDLPTPTETPKQLPNSPNNRHYHHDNRTPHAASPCRVH